MHHLEHFWMVIMTRTTGQIGPQLLLRQQAACGPAHEKLAFTIAETCAATGLGRTSIYEAINSGALKSLRACGRRVILRSDLIDFLEACRN